MFCHTHALCLQLAEVSCLKPLAPPPPSRAGPGRGQALAECLTAKGEVHLLHLTETVSICAAPPLRSPPVGKASGPGNSTDESKGGGSALRQLRHMQAAPQMARKPEAFNMSELSPLTYSVYSYLTVPCSCHTCSLSKPVGRHHDPVYR